MRNTPCYLAFLASLISTEVWSAVEQAAEPANEAGLYAEMRKETADPWYQVELIVFANTHDDSLNEKWPEQSPFYPPRMVTIGPALAEQLLPQNLNQLRIAEEHRKTTEAFATIAAELPVSSEFLFDNLSIENSSGSTTNSNLSLDKEDLMTGLIHQHSDTPAVDKAIKDQDPADLVVSDNQVATSSVQDENQQVTAGPDLEVLFQENPLYQVYRSLPPDELKLKSMASRIRRSPQYELLHHSAWRQPIQAMEQAIPILLQAGNQFDDKFELDGFFTVSRARFLHIDTNLWFTTFIPRSGQASMIMPDKTLHYSQEDKLLLEEFPRINQVESRRNNYLPQSTYHMVQSRRMRSSTLHYLDHPAFGLLVRIDEFKLTD